MIVFILLFFTGVLFIPLSIKTIVHNNKITIYIMIFKMKFKILNRDSLIDFGEKSAKEVKYSKTYNIFKREIDESKNYLKKINFFGILKKVYTYLDLSLDFNIKFGFARRDITAQVFGLLFSIFPIIHTLIHKFIKVSEFTYKFYPNFNTVCFDIKVISNIKTNLFKLILIIFILVKEILRVRRIYKAKLKEC